MSRLVMMLAVLVGCADREAGAPSSGGPLAAGQAPFGSLQAPGDVGLASPLFTSAPDADDDGDGLDNASEAAIGTDPTNPDTDGGGVPDGDEFYYYWSDPLDSADDALCGVDTDQDGLWDLDELAIGTDPNLADTDGGGVDDWWEYVVYWSNPLDPTDDAMCGVDTDEDGLWDVDELAIGTDPNLADTDGGGVSDYWEWVVYWSNPLDPADDALLESDTDGDGLSDWDESWYGTDPTLVDTDGGGVSDEREVFVGTDPLDGTDDVVDELGDDDGDGLDNGDEAWFGSDPTNPDTDGGGADDYLEWMFYGNPINGADDAALVLDTDGDGMLDVWEAFYGSDPTNVDTDGGGETDGDEFDDYKDPTDPSDDGISTGDTDGDGLSDLVESWWGTDPNLYDTDGGGASDWSEFFDSHTDPTDPADDVTDPHGDTDGDGLDNATESWWGSDPTLVDTDGGGADDKFEFDLYWTDPTNASDDVILTSDTDGGGQIDGLEILSGKNMYDPSDD